MRRITGIIILFLISPLLNAQEQPSIHQTEYRQYRDLTKQSSLFDPSGKDIIPLQFDKAGALSAVVFGYLPDWEYTNRGYLQYDLLTHIAAFDFTVSANGQVSYPSYWPWTGVINQAHENGVKVVMTAVNFDSAEIRIILTDESVKSNFFTNCRNIINTYQLDGVNVDFEGMKSIYRGALLNGFMADLTEYIHQEIPGAEVSFAGPAVNWGGWDLYGLAQSCDYIFIMGYAFYGSWSATSGPCSPLTGGSINITNTVLTQYGSVTANHPEKLILGVPYYGNRWWTETSAARSTKVEYIGSIRFRTAQPEADTYGYLWEQTSQTPWYRYQGVNEWYQAWFDDAASLGLKYDLAEAYNLLGVGMWALCYDGSRTELWDELRSRYETGMVIPAHDSKYPGISQFRLFRNYPNPFNSGTTIRYVIAETHGGAYPHVELEIYNVLGQNMATLVSERQPSGEYAFYWDASAFPSGVYYCRLTAGGTEQPISNAQFRRMVLIR